MRNKTPYFIAPFLLLLGYILGFVVFGEKIIWHGVLVFSITTIATSFCINMWDNVFNKER